MKSKVLIAVMFALAGVASLPVEAGNPNAPRFNRIAVVPVSISSEEAATLLWMREEEKLAHDVYQTLYAQWGDVVFQRIANSEQRHFNALGKQLERFDLADPASPFLGIFSQTELQDLYLKLLSDGSQGYLQALTVGATIEDLDIADLVAVIDTTPDPILKRTYEHLLEGSKNHLRAFVSLLRSLGSDYAPVYIDELLFSTIVGD